MSHDLGYQHGSADKLAGRPYDDSRSSDSAYKKGYKKGYRGTKVPKAPSASTGALSFSASASADFGTSPPSGTEGNANQGFDPPPLSEPVASNPFQGKLQAVAPRTPIGVAQRQVASPFGAPAGPPPIPNQQIMPGQQVTTTPVPTGPGPEAMVAFPTTTDKVMAWMKDNWPYLAAGAGVLAVGMTIYAVAKSREQHKPAA